MTCIVAHRSGWIAADTRGCAEDRIVPAIFKKILRAKSPETGLTHTLVALCGQANAYHDFEQLMLEAGQDQQRTIPLLAAYLSEREDSGKHGYCTLLAVNNRHEIYKLDSVGSYHNLLPEVEFECDGSGRDVAHGYLMAVQARNGVVTPDDARDAINAAATQTFTVGGPVIVETLYN